MSTARGLAACIAIRICVFVREQSVPIAEEVDALDAAATHYLAKWQGTPIGTARVVMLGNRTAKIGRLAVLPAYRGQGVGRCIMNRILAADDGSPLRYVLDAQLRAIRFYHQFGFRAHGPVFLDAGIEHRRMSLNTARRGG